MRTEAEMIEEARLTALTFLVETAIALSLAPMREDVSTALLQRLVTVSRNWSVMPGTGLVDANEQEAIAEVRQEMVRSHAAHIEAMIGMLRASRRPEPTG